MAPSSHNCFKELSCSVCNGLQDSIKSLHYHQTYFHSTQELSLALLSLKGWDINLLMECDEQKSRPENNECQAYYQLLNGKPVNSYSLSVGQQDEDITTCKIENMKSSQVNDEGENEVEKCTLNDTLNSVKMSNDILINDLDKSPPSQLDSASLQVGYYEETHPDRWPVVYPQELNLKSNDILSDSETDTDIEVESNEKLFDSDCEIKMDVFDLYNSYKSSLTTGESINFKQEEEGNENTGKMFHKSNLERNGRRNESAGTSTLPSSRELVCVQERKPVGDTRSVYSCETSRSLTPKMKEETFSSLSTDTVQSPRDSMDSKNEVLLPPCSDLVSGANTVHNRSVQFDYPSILCSVAKSLERETDFVDFFLSPADIDSENLSEKCESPDVLSGDLQKDMEETTNLSSTAGCIFYDKANKAFRKMKTAEEFLEITTDENISTLMTTQNGDSKIKSVRCFGGFYRAKAIPGLIIDANVSKVSERRFFCESCGKGYKKKSHLERHLRVHTGERPFPCPYCTKRFAVRSILKQHIRIHTGEKPYSCDFCSQRFPQKSGLMTHMMLHTGKPFKCDICEKSFVSNHKLLQHLKGHDSQQKSYSCSKCKLEFFTVGALSDHETVHEKDLNHECQKCEESFTEETLLKTDVEKHENSSQHSNSLK